ncbi:ADP-ribosylglycohydrolase [Weissella uvarum]|uniref:ADP-ribosylglycohydrolase family protein n=1 Tax=Weissella uvarum TaxID=1479233 RepID=UPI00195FB75B|nr:ADP-ribosylglycohydrolase family protein [Weissella uvarum]MBM7617440.1 ADP-ribosylglycohydrolase [Weissella uvarum]MCM0595675.1 ADP-ribosylglycohydrolase family protein [Weissella uvarum]
MNETQSPLTQTTYGLINADCYAEKQEYSDITDWSSASSLSLATIASLTRGYNLNHLMDQFTAWYARGDYTADRSVQLSDRTTIRSIEHYMINHDPFSSGSNQTEDVDDGALLRIMPAVLFLNTEYGDDFVVDDPAMLILHQITGLTHNQPVALIANGIYAMFVNQLLAQVTPVDALESAIDTAYDYYSKHQVFQNSLSAFNQLNTPDFKHTHVTELTASNQVTDTLTACIWIILNAESYQDALSKCNQLAGDPQTLLPLVGSTAALLFEPDQAAMASVNKNGLNQVKRILTAGNRSHRFKRYNPFY